MKTLFNDARELVCVGADKVARAAKSPALRLATAGGALLGVSGAHAAGEFTFDPAPVVGAIATGVTAISAIGVAVISLVVVIKLFKWVQRVL